MARELVNDFLLVSRYSEPPAEVTIAQAFSAAGLGAPTYQVAAPAAISPGDAPPASQRLGSYRMTAPHDWRDAAYQRDSP